MYVDHEIRAHVTMINVSNILKYGDYGTGLTSVDIFIVKLAMLL